VGSKTLASEYVITAPPDTPARELARLMKGQGIGDVIIVEEGVPVGIVTDRDLVARVMAPGKDAMTVTARGVMQKNPVTIRRGEGLFTALRKMAEGGFRRLPVVEDDVVVDVVTYDDVIRLLAGGFGELAEVAAAESPRRDLTNVMNL